MGMSFGSFAQRKSGTETSISDSGVEKVTNVSDINFDKDLDVTDDGDGTVTIDFPPQLKAFINIGL